MSFSGTQFNPLSATEMHACRMLIVYNIQSFQVGRLQTCGWSVQFLWAIRFGGTMVNFFNLSSLIAFKVV
jgi:hypothetical protein